MKSSLKTIKAKLNEYAEQLTLGVANIPNTALATMSNLNNLRTAITEIHSLGVFNGNTTPLMESVIFKSGGDSMQIVATEANSLQLQVNRLKASSKTLLTVLRETVPEESPESINIKLPPIKDFEELSKVSKELHVALTQVIYDKEIGGKEEIVSVENGSIWFNVFVGATAVSVIASMVWSAAVIYKKIQEGRLLEEQIRGLKVKNESLQDILKAQKAETDRMLQAEADYIASEYFKENLPENIGKIKNSITTFAELITKGAEIKPSLMAPEEVSNLFPKATELLGIESKIKKLNPHQDN